MPDDGRSEDADEQGSSSPDSTPSRQDAEAQGASSPDSASPRRDAGEQTSSSPDSTPSRQDAEAQGASSPRSQAREDADGQSAPIDHDVVDRIAARLGASERFESVDVRPEYAPNSVVLDYDLGYFPPDVDRAYLHVRWYENDDVSAHYTEQRGDGGRWECRWDRHPNGHNARDHVHPPPDAATPGDDASFPRDWRDVVERVLGRLDEHIRGLWD